MSGFGTHLAVDHESALQVVICCDTVELRCAGTAILLDTECCDQLITMSETTLAELAGTGGPRGERVVGDAAASTWVRCDSTEPMSWAVRGGGLEAHWGPLVLDVTGSALPGLIRRVRAAQTALARRLAAPSDDDQERIILDV